MATTRTTIAVEFYNRGIEGDHCSARLHTNWSSQEAMRISNRIIETFEQSTDWSKDCDGNFRLSIEFGSASYNFVEFGGGVDVERLDYDHDPSELTDLLTEYPLIWLKEISFEGFMIYDLMDVCACRTSIHAVSIELTNEELELLPQVLDTLTAAAHGGVSYEPDTFHGARFTYGDEANERVRHLHDLEASVLVRPINVLTDLELTALANRVSMEKLVRWNTRSEES